MNHRDDEIIGVTRATAARVLDVSEDRLKSWNRMGLVMSSTTTSIGRRSVWTYSLEDLVQGGVVRQLEDRGIHIRAIRRVVEAVRTHIDPAPLASLRWAVDGPDVFVGYPDGNWVNGRRPGENIIPDIIELDAIRAQMRDAARSRPRSAEGQVERRRGALASTPVFAGTRVPVATVVRYLDEGMSDDQIVESFPSLTSKDIEAARESVPA